MNIFTFDRIGTKITAAERLEIQEAINQMQAVLKDPVKLQQTADSLSGCTEYTWGVSQVMQTLEADIYGFEKTLETGEVAVW